jgi:hypothetical protein
LATTPASSITTSFQLFGSASTLVIDLETQRIVASLVRGPCGTSANNVRDAVDEVRWDDSAERVAVHCYDPLVALWDVRTGALLGTVDDVPPGRFTITSDGAGSQPRRLTATSGSRTSRPAGCST